MNIIYSVKDKNISIVKNNTKLVGSRSWEYSPYIYRSEIYR